ncbi:MAG TPA: hypothetical protein VK557_00385 [Pyrinomonadaceae bacterium]|nr:hypothetical protein [Pyrinomonadaceae bacterium]
MKNRIRLSIIVAAGAAAICTGQSRQGSPPPPVPAPSPVVTTEGIKVDVKGSFDGPIYSNKVLGFNVSVPQGWQVQDTETRTEFASRVTEKTNSANAEKPAVKAYLSRTTLLFILVRPTETATNPTIFAMAEDIALAFNVRTPEQYLMSARKVGDNTPMLFDAYTTSGKINGIDFAWMEAVPKNSAVILKQRYYATLRHHHAIGFVMTFHTEQEFQWCMEVMNSIKFE